MKRLLATAVAVLATASMSAVAGSAGSPPDFEPLAELIRQTKDATGHPSGTAVAVVKDGEVIYEGYFGFRDIEHAAPVTRDTVFYIASVTKPLFALNVLLREHDGQLDTRTSLQQMFPDMRFADLDATQVTIRDLLVHTSGVDNLPLVWATAFSGVHDASSRHRLVAASYPNRKAALGTFDYTNVGYNIASVWLDEQLAMPWQDQLDHAIFQPLGMQHTSAYISEARAEQWPLAKPYSFVSAQPSQPLYLSKADSTMHAAGGLVSTAPDLARFLIAQLASAGAAHDPALPPTVVERSHATQVTLDDRYLDFPRTGYAWGWYTGEYKGRRMLHHFGGFAGFHAHLSFMPDAGIGLVVLNNEGMLSSRLTSLIADYAYGVLLQQPDTKARVAGRFEALHAQAAKLRAAIRHHREEIRARAWNLSLPRAAYAGTYSNPLVGDITVALNERQEMVVRWGRLTTTATAYEQRDHVRVEFVPNSGEPLVFTVDGGRIEGLVFEEMVFAKTP